MDLRQIGLNPKAPAILDTQHPIVANIQILPIELIFKILTYLSGIDLILAQSVCRHWKILISEDFLWEPRIPRIAGNQLHTLDPQVQKGLIFEEALEKKSFQVKTFSGGLNSPLRPTNFFVQGAKLYVNHDQHSYICIDIVTDKVTKSWEIYNHRTDFLVMNERWLIWHTFIGEYKNTSLWSVIDLNRLRSSSEIGNVPAPLKQVQLHGNLLFFETAVNDKKLVVVKNLERLSGNHIYADAWCCVLSPMQQIFFYRKETNSISVFQFDQNKTCSDVIRLDDQNPLRELKEKDTYIAGISENVLNLWDKLTYKLLRKVEVSFCIQDFSLDEHLVILYSTDERVHVYSILKDQILSSFSVEGISQRVNIQKTINANHLFFKNAEGSLSIYNLLTGCKVMGQGDWQKPFLKIQVVENVLYGLHEDGLKAYTFMRKKMCL